MASEKELGPPSTEVSPLDLQLSACAIEGHSDGTADISSDTVRLAVGELLGGRYRIERELGEGGMGVVYLAADEQVPGERFALKVLKEELRPEVLTLLREEVRKTRKLSHPNIVDVHSVNVDGQKLYVLMEYLEGKSLDELLDEEFGRGMPFSHAWPIIEDVGAALGNAHDHNVIHSDLKPANVFITNSGRTKLLDFGIARVSRGPLLHTVSGPRALTPAYASCEMLEGKEADRRDDIYSFACAIYEMLCGERPFGDLTALEAREASTRARPLQGLSPEQNAALVHALAFDRDRRTSSVEELLQGLAADRKPRRRAAAVLGAAIIAAVAMVGSTYLYVHNQRIARQSVMVQSPGPGAGAAPSAAAATTVAFNPPPHSIAVLPFVNMSGDKEQEYFSDGLSEELLNDLARINELQVAARTSAFSFKGKDTDIGTVARKLNVAAVLEGSVRRSAHRVRVTAQLINAATGFHVWSETYDRDLGDVLKLQTEIATSVASALKVSLLGDEGRKIELGGTRNPAAQDAYLRATKTYWTTPDTSPQTPAFAAYTEAINMDPEYALAYAGRSLAELSRVTAPGDLLAKAQHDARKAIELAPALAEGHLALAGVHNTLLEFGAANEEYKRALALAPGNTRVLRNYGAFAVRIGLGDSGLAMMRRAAALDPLNAESYAQLGDVLIMLRRGAEAIEAHGHAEVLMPGCCISDMGYDSYVMGDFDGALSGCPQPPADDVCLAVAYMKLGRHADAEAAVARLRAALGDSAAYEYAQINAQWGNISKAVEWLETALRLRSPGLVNIKTDYLLDPLRKEPRFQAIERALKFPD